MKTLSMFAVILFSIFSVNTTNAQEVKNETIKVWGNCGMCKAKIEKAAKAAGASTASWDADSKELNVSYAVNKTSEMKIQQAVAAVGYDTKDFTAPSEVYEKLHGCCKYERKSDAETVSEKKCCDSKKCSHDGDANKDKKCCESKKCSHDGDASKDKKCCESKKCSHDGDTSKDKKCCDSKKCSHDGEACKDKKCCDKKSSSKKTENKN